MEKKKSTVAIDLSEGPVEGFDSFFEKPAPQEAASPADPQVQPAEEPQGASAVDPRERRSRRPQREAPGRAKGDPKGSVEYVSVKISLQAKARLDLVKALLEMSGRSYPYSELLQGLIEGGLKGLSREAWEKYRLMGSAGGD